jgi:hypothetical protein
MISLDDDSLRGEDRVFLALAEQLKLPFLHISQHMELVRLGNDVRPEHVESVADMAMHLIDSYLLSRQLSRSQTSLQLEPVTVSSVLQAAAERLDKIAKEYECDIEVHLSGRYGPVMGHRQSLEAAMVALGYSFMEAQQNTDTKKRRLVLAAHKSRAGIVAGTYGDQNELTTDMFQRAKIIHGIARQSVTVMGHSSGAGIFVADRLFGIMASKLKVSRHSRLTGLAATLAPNPQLQLV